LVPHLPSRGNALEVASGTGEHVVRLAEATPGLAWHPTDIDPERLTSITAWTIHNGATNIRPPLAYNPVEEAWPGAPMDAVYLSNLIHLISTEAARSLLSHLAGALAPGVLIAIYGPFKRGTAYASDGDERFDAAIRAERPDAGYKDIGWVEAELSGHRLIKHTHTRHARQQPHDPLDPTVMTHRFTGPHLVLACLALFWPTSSLHAQTIDVAQLPGGIDLTITRLADQNAQVLAANGNEILRAPAITIDLDLLDINGECCRIAIVQAAADDPACPASPYGVTIQFGQPWLQGPIGQPCLPYASAGYPGGAILFSPPELSSRRRRCDARSGTRPVSSWPNQLRPARRPRLGCARWRGRRLQ
jgi:hypothetical protein